MKVVYAVTNPGLLDIPELLPEPVSKFIPEWYKNVPVKKDIPYPDGFVPKSAVNILCMSVTDESGLVLEFCLRLWKPK